MTGSDAKPIAVWDLIVWAFRHECAQLEHPDDHDQFNKAVVSSSYMICQQMMLGCIVDGGGRSSNHPDADVVAAAVAALPEPCGGWRMACLIADWAKAAARPTWDIPCVIRPVDMQQNQHGRQAKTIDSSELGDIGWPPQPRRNRKGAIVYDQVRCCPVHCQGDPKEQAEARRNYLLWWTALLEIKTTFQIHPNLSAFVVTDEMPPIEPWRK